MTARYYAIPEAALTLREARYGNVEASAGTGKTYLIEHRVLDLLLTQEVELSKILIVTFTERATRDLRERLRSLLQGLLAGTRTTSQKPPDSAAYWTIDEQAHKRIHAALAGFDSASIQTIHGYCRTILNEHAFQHGRLFEETQVASHTAFSSTFKRLIRTTFANDDSYAPYLRAWLRNRGRNVADLIALLHRCLEQQAMITPRFDEALLTRLLAASAGEFPGVDRDILCDQLNTATRAVTAQAILRRIDILSDLLESYASHRCTAQFLHEFDTADAKLRDYLEDFCRLSLSEPRTTSLVGHIAELLAATVSLPTALAQKFLPLVAEEVDRDKRARGEFDFGDMLDLVWQTVRDGDDATLALLRERHPHVLIDEFQDTDPVQWQIFKQLYVSAPTEGSFCIIGDPKQAIYGFRGADLYTYLEATRELQAIGATRILLQDNYRSSHAMIDAFNTIFCPRLGTTFFTGDVDYPVAGSAGRIDIVDPEDAASSAVTLYEPEPGAKMTADELRRFQRRFITGEIKNILDTVQLVRAGVDDTSSTTTTKLRASEIFVLTRTTSEAYDIAACLREATIPCSLFKQEGLFQTGVASDVLDLLCAIESPERLALRTRAWQTCFFNAELEELLGLADIDDNHAFVRALSRWHSLARSGDFPALFRAILDTSRVIERKLYEEDNERDLTDLLHVIEHLENDVMLAPCDLKTLISRLKSWIAGLDILESDERNLQRPDSTKEAVQVMTIHKSKGLEASVVFVYGGLGRPRNSLSVYHEDGKRHLHIGSKQNARAKAEQEQEDQRLLYVALTRAKVRLYLPFIDRAIYNRKLGGYAPLNSRLEAVRAALNARDTGATQPSAPSPEDQTLTRFRSLVLTPPAMATTPKRQGATWQLPAHINDRQDNVDYAALRWSRRSRLLTSYTQMKDRQADTKPTQSQHLGSLPAPTSPLALPGGAATGILLHELLELVPFASLADANDLATWLQDPRVADVFAATFRKHGFSKRYLVPAGQLVYQALRAPLQSGGATLPAVSQLQDVSRETEFMFSVPNKPRTVFIKGYLDILLRHEGQLFALDWKSDVLPDYTEDAIADYARDHYLLQAKTYTLALERMLSTTTSLPPLEAIGGVFYCFLRAFPDNAQHAFYLYRPTADEFARLPDELAVLASTTSGPIPGDSVSVASNDNPTYDSRQQLSQAITHLHNLTNGDQIGAGK